MSQNHDYIPKRVLLVDDEELVREVLRDTLEDIGISEIIEAENGQAGMNVLAQQAPFEVVFTDIKMPIMDGVTFLKKIRSEMNDRERPFLIAVTGGTTSDLKKGGDNSIEKLIDGHVFKPFKEEQVRKTLSEMKARRQNSNN